MLRTLLSDTTANAGSQLKVRGLDGRDYSWNLADRVPLESNEVQRSSYHLRARAVLRSLFPSDRILEEVYLPGSGGLSCDFFLPLRKLMVEAQGEQHYRFCVYFHGDRDGFLRAKKRDDDKRAWCELNGLTLAALPFNEDDLEWNRLLRQALTTSS